MEFCILDFNHIKFYMKFNLLLKIILFLALYSCNKSIPVSVFSHIQITPIIEDSLLNVRAIELNNKTLVAISSLGDMYRYDLNSKALMKKRFSKDTLNVRSMALVGDTVFALSIANPAYLYKNSKLVYFEKHLWCGKIFLQSRFNIK